ncbi:MAG: hypothetical protein IT384_06800 [Deltaproteobacteria bacterium]|nr:hypothetical protein [Deltaproteobacteria bacterium]
MRQRPTLRAEVVEALLLLAGCSACFDFGAPIDAGRPGGLKDAAAAGSDGGPGADDAQSSDGGLELDSGQIDTCVEGQVALTEPGLEVRIASHRVTPASSTLRSGGVVIWRNADDTQHRLVGGSPESPLRFEQGGFDSRALGRGQGYAHRFCRPRTLTYYCTSHSEQMRDYRLVIE